MKYYLIAIFCGFTIFLILPLGINEVPTGTFGPLDLPRVQTNFYPAFISIWKQYESAGLLPPSVWDFNPINIFVNLFISIIVSIIIYRKIKPKL